ncbi:MAG TPA: type I methionyl aminopeptidase [Firmicutes bacterium]|nr:type I methionyl aminopeptidase [Bacillota bacterium]
MSSRQSRHAWRRFRPQVRVPIKSREELDIMRLAGRIVALTLRRLSEVIRPGVTTAELDREAEDFIRSHSAVPSFKGLYGFPASICTSVNEEVVHGIPGPRRLVEGDIVSVDVGALIGGFHGDGAATLPVGEISDSARRLIQVTREALDRGIAKARSGNTVKDISGAVQSFVEANGFSVVRAYAGHGIGRKMHEDPQVPNFVVEADPDVTLVPGMTLAIEPMVNAGTWEVLVMPDGWTVVTADSSLSCHFEHTVAVTQNGPEILTLP